MPRAKKIKPDDGALELIGCITELAVPPPAPAKKTKLIKKKVKEPKSGESAVVVKTPVRKGIYVSSGCTILDLTCTGTTKGFCTAGHTVNIIGDRNSGKTALSLAGAAETEFRVPDYFEHKFIDLEQAMNFDISGLFGRKFADKLEVINPEISLEWSIESIGTKMLAWMAHRPQLFILDSVDAMQPEEEIKAILAGQNVERGPFGGPAPKALTVFFRSIIPAVAKSGSFLFVLSRAKDNLGFGAKFAPKTRAGGSSLGFNAFIEMWLAPHEQIKEGGSMVGRWTTAKIERSKVNGANKRECLFPILPKYGIDNTRANVRWLLDEGVIQMAEPITIKTAKALDIEPIKAGSYDLNNISINYVGTDPLGYIEANGLCDHLTACVKEHWDAKERDLHEKTFGGRESRYG